jgi:beta-lactam-binding protein with PASTA domain
MNLIKFLLSKRFLKQIIVAVLAGLLLVFVVLKWLGMTTNHNEFKEVPDLKGKSITVVKLLLEEQQLKLKIQDCTNYNPDYPKFSVLEQSPRVGSQVKENRKIYVTLNPSGYKKIKVPNVLGKTKRQAVFSLKALEFTIGKIVLKQGFAKDVVLGMEYKGENLKPNTLLSKTATIDVIISDGSLKFGELAPEIEKEDPIIEKEIK